MKLYAVGSLLAAFATVVGFSLAIQRSEGASPGVHCCRPTPCEVDEDCPLDCPCDEEELICSDG